MTSRAVFLKERLHVLCKIGGAASAGKNGNAKYDTRRPHKNFVTPGFGIGEGVKLPFQSITDGPNRSCEFMA